jgi:hypothetical protein
VCSSSPKRRFQLTPVRVGLVLAFVGLLSALPFYALAQDSNEQKPASVYSLYNGGAYIVYGLPNGESECRGATPEETHVVRDLSNGTGLRQINHLKGSQSIDSATGLTVILRATAQLDADPVAKQAFIDAAAKWEALIKDPITIIIDVDYGTTFFGTPFGDPNVLGATATQQLFFNGNYTDVRTRLINHANNAQETSLVNSLPTTSIATDIGATSTVLVASPVLRALGAIPPDASTDTTTPGSPPKIGFNSSFGFDFNPNDGITGNRTDFDAVAVHEIGHALGFNSQVGARELTPSDPIRTSLWDLFRFRPGTATLGTFNTAERVLSSGGSQAQFNGASELGLSTARGDASGGDGNQAPHWKDDSITGVYIGIMDPAISRNRREVMTDNDTHAIDYLGYTIVATLPPANDNFASAQVLTGCSGTVTGTNVASTKETGEPDHGGHGTRTVWYQWQAPSSASVTFTTASSGFDTVLAAYTGNAVGSLSLITSNDDVVANTDFTSSITFAATGGTIYRIAVEGYNNASSGGDVGAIQLNWNAPGCTTSTPPSIQLEFATYNFSEGIGNAQVHVKRTGDTTGASSINFSTGGNSFFACSTINGSAVQNCDFILNQGTLAFAAGQTDRSINILINDDTYVEGNETLTLTLSSPVNATLGSPGSATLTITDNDSAGATVPGAKTFIAALNAASEVPPTGTSGKGGGMVQLDAAETGGKAGLLFSNLSSAETAAHIHGPAAIGVNAPILFPLPLGTVTDFAFSPTSQQVTDLKAGQHYMNVHSNNFLNGEIRGQLLWNPLNEVNYFVTQHYYDFLGRLPDQSGFDFWTNEMKQCGINVQCFRDKSVDVSNAFFYEQEYQQTASYVFLLYRASYGNTQPFPNPDPANPTEANKLPRYLTFVRDRVQVVGGTNLAASQKALADAFVQRAEFIARYPASLSTGAQFVDAVLATINTADGATFAPADRTALITHFNNGGRGLVMFHLANDYWNGCNRLPGNPAAPCVPAGFGAAVDNRAFIDAEYNRSFVYSQYSGYLRRDGDIDGFIFWLNQVSAAPPRNVAKQHGMVCSFITSAEYQQRFGVNAPRTNAECTP